MPWQHKSKKATKVFLLPVFSFVQLNLCSLSGPVRSPASCNGGVQTTNKLGFLPSEEENVAIPGDYCLPGRTETPGDFGPRRTGSGQPRLSDVMNS